MKIRELRLKEGLTQTELARLVSVAQNTVAGWESGVRKPDIRRLKSLASALGVTIDELLSEDE